MNKKDYIDEVLIKLKREYSKDEFLRAIIKENSKLLIENGKLQVEIQYLEQELVKLNDINSSEYKEFLENRKLESKHANTIKNLKQHIKKQEKTIENLQKSVSELIIQNLQNQRNNS